MAIWSRKRALAFDALRQRQRDQLVAPPEVLALVLAAVADASVFEEAGRQQRLPRALERGFPGSDQREARRSAGKSSHAALRCRRVRLPVRSRRQIEIFPLKLLRA
ncbi:MAG: hypothetical protein U0703_19905 [Anaerolineae bacterium]